MCEEAGDDGERSEAVDAHDSGDTRREREEFVVSTDNPTDEEGVSDDEE